MKNPLVAIHLNYLCWREKRSRKFNGVFDWKNNPLAFLRLRYRRWQVNRSLRVLDALDWNMKRAGWKRAERRQFWRDFIKKQGFRMEVFNKLTQK